MRRYIHLDSRLDVSSEFMLITVHVGFCHERALILYVYVRNDEGSNESVLTVCMRSSTHD